ncbi:MAG: cytochrome C [Geobacter sp.]|nr:cytochrome C [Geobacter sp.]
MMKKTLAAFGLASIAAATVNAQEVTWSNSIKGIVEKQCVICHGSDSAAEYQLFKKDKEKWLAKGQGMRMDSYSHLVSFVGWPNSGAMMRRLDDGKSSSDGKQGNMYQHLGATEEERQQNLAQFKAWVGNWTLKRWAEITRDDLSGIKAKY